MKRLAQYLHESENKSIDTGEAFSDTFKYTEEDFKKFMKATENELAFHLTDGLYLIFCGDEHIATYDPKRHIVMTDDTKLFGHDVK